MKSILQDKKESYISGSTYNLEEHHIFFGTANRKISEKQGFKVWLTSEEHRGTYGVHGKYGKDLNLYLKQIAQRRWQEYYKKTKEEFRKRFGKNYL